MISLYSNLDRYTETYSLNYYLNYLLKYPQYFKVANHHSGYLAGYIFGKSEGKGENWHGHITAVTVAPNFRRLGVAQHLIHILEETATKENAYFVDLFVRPSNSIALEMYRQLGYVHYRTILGYYMDYDNEDNDEDGFGKSNCINFIHYI